jgi:hypothetical protein
MNRLLLDDYVVIFDAHIIPSIPEIGGDAGYNGAKKCKGRKVHPAVDILGHLLALVVTPASKQERRQVNELAAQVQEVTGGSVETKAIPVTNLVKTPLGMASN